MALTPAPPHCSIQVPLAPRQDSQSRKTPDIRYWHATSAKPPGGSSRTILTFSTRATLPTRLAPDVFYFGLAADGNMDSSPLVKAHDHAHAAAVATRQASDTTVAINEHTQAAGEFANAARTTSSVEALRTLKLLEEHHRRLAEILKLSPEQTSPTNDDDDDDDDDDHHHLNEKAGSEKAQSDGDPKSKTSAGAAAAKTAQMPSLSQQRRYASREMSSSIASNLASARGIRSKYRGQPLSPSVSNDQAPGNVDHHPRRDGSKVKMQTIIDSQPSKPTWVPPTSSVPAQEAVQSKPPTSPRSDAGSAVSDDVGYTRFYNTFGSLINKISAPLAFAGLPLIQEESAPSQSVESPEPSPTKRQRARPTVTVSTEPDLNKIYSKATMRTLAKDGHLPSDSFYVVPTTGHTMSYANIMTYAEKEKRRSEASVHRDMVGAPAEDEEDDFVDARETPVPLSPGARRRVGRARTDKELNNTIEELYLENKSLKDMLDKLSKRLHAFEASAQNSAMALAESYRVMRPGSPMSAGGGSRLGDDVSRAKMQEMEEQLASAMTHNEKLEKDNRKMQKTLEKYREKWETLKASAKARREAQEAGADPEDGTQSQK
ncbi:hypothetical protein S40288_08461 [Stachybotrys chartarum IBT 40288]|nr:hypothetical protein S40288_08461 [Stachybotrys chartarum IBT 40288]